MLDKIPERLRTAAEGMARATQMMADDKSRRNQAAGDVGACYEGLKREETAEWQGADLIEKYEAALREILRMHPDPRQQANITARAALKPRDR